MIRQMNLEDAVKIIYGKSFKRIVDIKSHWYLFTPYQNLYTKQVLYFRVLQAPNSYHTSEDVFTKTLVHFKGLIHDIQIILVQRSFQTVFYLLKASTNIISLQGIINLRSECGQKVQPMIIYKMIQFLILLEKKKKLSDFNVDTSALGIIQNGNYRICDYSLYFLKKQQHKTVSLKQLIYQLAMNLITLSSQTNRTYQQIYIISLQFYNQKFANFISTLLNLNPFSLGKITDLLTVEMQNQFDGVTTLSESSFIQENDFRGDIYVEYGSFHENVKLKKQENQNLKKITNRKSLKISLTQSDDLSTIQESKNKKVSVLKKFIICVPIFIFLSLVIIGGTIMALHFISNPIKCQQGQFLNIKNTCEDCNSSCERCVGSLQNQCLSCKGAMFWVIKTPDDKTGVCMKQCKGKYIAQRNACIQNL